MTHNKTLWLTSKVLSPLAYGQMREYVKWWDELIESKKGSEHENSQGTPSSMLRWSLH